MVTDYDKKRAEIAQEITDLVATTSGPYGTNVHVFTRQGVKMYRDGKKVLEAYQPKDLTGDGIKQLMLSAADRTVRKAGDGSTTTTILLNEIYRLALLQLDGRSSRRQVARLIRQEKASIIAYLREKAKVLSLGNPEDRRLLQHVATIAGNNDPQIGAVVSGVICDVGKDGYVVTEYDENVTDLCFETRPGYRLPHGILHATMLPTGRSRVQITDPVVAIVKQSLTTNEQLSKIVAAWSGFCQAQDGNLNRPLLIICTGIESEARNTAIMRSIGGQRMPWYVVSAPGDFRMWEDLEAISGADMISGSEKKSVLYFTMKNAVIMPSVTIGVNETILPIDLQALQQNGLIERLKSLEADASTDQKAEIKSRIARLEGRVGVIKVPKATMARDSWTSEVLEDAYLASVSALEDGVLPGAGRALSACLSQGLYTPVRAALPKVMETLLKNGANQSESIEMFVVQACRDFSDETISLDDSFEVRIVNAFEDGILDSAAAVIAAVENACEEAADWIETPNCIAV